MSKFIASLNAPLPPVSSTSEFDDLTFFASTDMFDFDAIDTRPPVDQSVNLAQADPASSVTMPPWNLRTGPGYVMCYVSYISCPTCLDITKFPSPSDCSVTHQWLYHEPLSFFASAL
jgi:hypothetical protein